MTRPVTDEFNVGDGSIAAVGFERFQRRAQDADRRVLADIRAINAALDAAEFGNPDRDREDAQCLEYGA